MYSRSTSKGGINCANKWFDPSRVHEIVKGDDIFWVNVKGRNLGYCGYCCEELFIQKDKTTDKESIPR